MDAAVIPPATPVRKRPTWSIHRSEAPPSIMYLRHTYSMNTYKTNNTCRLLHTHHDPPLDLTAYIIQFIQNTEGSVKLVPLMNFALFKPLAVLDIQLSSLGFLT